MPKKKYGLSLIELLVSVVLMSLVLLGFFTIDLFSRNHVVTADRRAKVQNDISNALEHMSKYIQRSNGNRNRNAIQALANGFRVYIDLRNTPSVFTDDGYLDYTLSGNTLSVTCTPNGGTCPFTSPENLSNKVIAGGFYVNITDFGTEAEIGLTGRYVPTLAADLGNPQIL
jgi:Tfp pilus assembly protein PilV